LHVSRMPSTLLFHTNRRLLDRPVADLLE